MSNLKVSTLAGLTGASVPIADVVNGTARAWVNFNGTGTVAIMASGNVSSITDNGTGDYTVNFTNAMPDANYSTTSTTSLAGGNAGTSWVSNQAVSATRISTGYVNSIFLYADPPQVNVAIFR